MTQNGAGKNSAQNHENLRSKQEIQTPHKRWRQRTSLQRQRD